MGAGSEGQSPEGNPRPRSRSAWRGEERDSGDRGGPGSSVPEGLLRARLLSAGLRRGRWGETRKKEASRGPLGQFCPPKSVRGSGKSRDLPSCAPQGTSSQCSRPFRNSSGLTGALPFPKFPATAESFRAVGGKITVNQRGTRVGFVQTPAIFFNSDRTPVLQLQRILTASCKSPQIQHTQQSRLTGIQGCPAPLLEAPQEPQTSAVLQLPAALHPLLWVCPPDLRLGLNLSPGSRGRSALRRSGFPLAGSDSRAGGDGPRQQ